MEISKKSFLEEIDKYDGIVCYGVGKRFEEFREMFCEKSIIDKLLFCVDRNYKIYGGKVKFAKRELKVYPIESLKQIENKNILIFITCNRFLAILEQLKSEIDLRKYHIYAFTPLYGSILEAEAMKKEMPLNVKLSKNQLIPKVIHYCWFGKKQLPDRHQKWIESWYKYCPDYEIKLWNEDNYDVTKNSYMKEAYENQKWGFVPDFARLDIIYHHGGIYLDTDVELIKNIDDLLYEKAFICFETGKVNLGSGFGAQKNMPMIKCMMDDYQNRHFVKFDGSLDIKTSSNTIQSQLLQRMGVTMNGEYQVFNDLTIFPEKVMCGKHEITRNIRLKSYTRAIHHFEGSWLDDESQLQMLYLEQNKKK